MCGWPVRVVLLPGTSARICKRLRLSRGRGAPWGGSATYASRPLLAPVVWRHGIAGASSPPCGARRCTAPSRLHRGGAVLLLAGPTLTHERAGLAALLLAASLLVAACSSDPTCDDVDDLTEQLAGTDPDDPDYNGLVEDLNLRPGRLQRRWRRLLTDAEAAQRVEQPVDIGVVGVRRQPDPQAAVLAEADPPRRLVGVEGAGRRVDAARGEVAGDVAGVVAARRWPARSASGGPRASAA